MAALALAACAQARRLTADAPAAFGVVARAARSFADVGHCAVAGHQRRRRRLALRELARYEGGGVLARARPRRSQRDVEGVALGDGREEACAVDGAPLQLVRVLRDHRAHRIHAGVGDGPERSHEVLAVGGVAASGDAAPVEEDGRVGRPCAPVPGPLPLLAWVEEYGDAAEEQGVDDLRRGGRGGEGG